MWSPQHYISEGKALGVDAALINAAVDQIEQVAGGRYQLPSILTLNHLAIRAQVSYSTLRDIVSRTDDDPYKHFYIRKRSGGRRLISIPKLELMQVQRWIAARVLRNIPVHPSAFAFIPGRSIVDCAARHTGARWLIKLDVVDFFGSITEIQAYRVFRELGYQPLVAFELARICTYLPATSYRYKSSAWQVWRQRNTIRSYRADLIGRLPQGAPTSPMLSNLAMSKLDAQLAEIARRRRVTYTRYSDDLTFSSREDSFGRRRSIELVYAVSRTLRKVGLNPNFPKTAIVPPGARKVVLGLLVDGNRPKLPSTFKSLLRQHLYYLHKFGPLEHAKSRGFETLGGMYRYLRGLIDFANMVDDEYAAEALNRLESVDWPA